MRRTEAVRAEIVLIPFVQGNVFRPIIPLNLKAMFVLIPFVQGNVFRHSKSEYKKADLSLNPFRTGQCLSTRLWLVLRLLPYVLIPFVQGNVFRPKLTTKL